MGRRKERRAAASMAAGRRVKLDLFAEPSSSGENNNQVEEGGGEGIMDVRDAKKKKNSNRVNGEEGEEGEERVPNSKSSPSSSGKRQENPLLLLGQYSDEEAIEEEPTEDIHPKTASAEQIAQVEEFVATECGNMEDNTTECSAVENVNEELNTESTQLNATKDLEGNGSEESGSVPLDVALKADESTTLTSEAWTSVVQVAGEVVYGWKLVMHEETNQYYYWNIETGETSWEVPAIFAQGAELGTEQEVPSVIEGSEAGPSNVDASCSLHKEPVVYSSVAAGSLCTSNCMISNDEEKCKHMDQVNNKNEGYTVENVVYPELGGAIHQIELESTDIRTSLGFQGMNEQPQIANEHHESGVIISTRLVSYAESLIQKLEELRRSDVRLQGMDWISKYILEIEIRLSDFKSLLTYGSSLLPFWMHSEEKLKGLEHAINGHISQLRESDQTNEGDKISSHRDESTSHIIIGDSEMKIRNQTAAPSVQNPQSSTNLDASIFQKEAEDKSDEVNDKQILPSASVGNVVEGKSQEFNEAVLPTGLILQSVPSIVEDEDMDVDMEVDEEITTSDPRFRDALSSTCFPKPEHSSECDPFREHPPSMLEEEYGVPPPPDEDWIPPPPPDAEPVPPPPPDDPPAPTNGPELPYSEAVLHFPYTEQYMSYPVSGSEYYGSTVTEVPSSNYYAHSEESQAVDPQSAQYFSTISTTYSETTPVIVNPVHPSVYYDLPHGTVPSVPAKSCFESSGIYGQSDSVSYKDTTEQTGIRGNTAKTECNSLPNLKVETDGFVRETETAAAHNPPLSTTVQTTAATGPVPSTSSTACGVVAPSNIAAKAPTKVVRSKKRTIAVAPTLRSNKKVSSLVDKWKAAKEELHEDEEDEPQDAYELLEWKRQREIEQWRAHQIATGEAKDNANFQPLGGDWRERVKRKRAQANRKSLQSIPEVPVERKQSPDLKELSKDLPSGWQVYWDESSKTAYYGNTTTMETTWTRPTQ